MKLEPYWWEAAPLRDLPGRPIKPSCDVAVIGGGYAGLHAALGLAMAGRSVQIFDKERPGFGGSSRNGGIVSGTTKFKLNELIASHGLDAAKALFQEGLDAENWLRRFIEGHKIACKYTRSGRFVGAYRPADYDLLAREAETINKHFARDVRVVPKSEQHTEVGTDFYHGGISTDDVCGLHPALYHAGLMDCALDAGVAVHGECPVLGFHRDGDRIEVETAQGTVRTRDLVVATNAYTDKNLPWLRRRLVPAASQIIATEPLTKGVLDRLMPKKRMLVDTRIMFPYYRPSPDHTRIVFGGRAGAWSDDPTVKAKALQRDLVSIFPELSETTLTHVWWGYVAFPFDRRPKLAHVDGIHYATGFCGSGTVWASWFGNLAARRIIEEGPVTTALGADPFESRPLYWGWPWFLPFILGWYRL
ncbi:MAG: FAD-binding oxidoreductase, partial [Gammaproteobacteria bacterium]|nr:FAD-binding oxidoreductase [Gammaproteobacteria bacterium]